MFEDLLQKGVNVQNEDIFYNYTDVSSMSKSKNGRPFQAAKEIHFVIIQALIKVYFQSRSLVVDLSTSTSSLKFLSFDSFFAFIPIFVFNFHVPSK
jgi:hypothetical protein